MGAAASIRVDGTDFSSFEGGPDKLREKLREKRGQVQVCLSKVEEYRKDGGDDKVTRRDVLPDGTTIEAWADGSKYQINPDGTRLVTYADKKSLKSANDTHLLSDPEGNFIQINTTDTIEKRVDGTQIQLTSGENLLLAQLPNGTSLQFDFNKRVGIEINADGSLYQKDLNSGQIVSKSADGVSVTTFPNGVTITSYPDGRQVQFSPDGGVTLETRPDGSRLQTNADGTTIEFTVDGE